MRALPSTIAVTLLLPLIALAQEGQSRYITRSHLNTVPPEIASASSIRVNAPDDLTLESLRGRLVLLLFTSTG